MGGRALGVELRPASGERNEGELRPGRRRAFRLGDDRNISVLSLGLLAIALLSCEGELFDGLESSPPNIILIISDDQNYRDFGFMGSTVARTPNLDRLADQGVVFTQAYSTSSVCRPALVSLLTGLYPHQWNHRLALLTSRGESDRESSIRQFRTLPRLLSKRGYATYQAGKNWEGTYEMAGFTHGITSAQVSSLTGKAREIHSMVGRETMEPVYEFVREHREGPFFVWFAPLLPHHPYDAPAKYAELYRDARMDRGELGYYANVSWFDDCVGQLLSYVDSLGIREQTLIVLVVDNGWTTTGDDKTEGYGFGGARGKGTLHEAGFRTPIVINWPGRVAAGGVRQMLVSTVDLFPTFLEYADVPSPPGRAGKSLVPLVEGRATQGHDMIVGSQQVIVWSPVGPRPTVARFLRNELWHYIERPEAEPQLYDVVADPDEETNLAEDHSDLITKFRKSITTERQRHLRMLRE
ncbi:MAG: sulfatase-like hydrolase/transferase [Myxococcales bacterium]|nr:sulfatase-like hydrolase/transferase [Myxococcales bacterium]